MFFKCDEKLYYICLHNIENHRALAKSPVCHLSRVWTHQPWSRSMPFVKRKEDFAAQKKKRRGKNPDVYISVMLLQCVNPGEVGHTCSGSTSGYL